MATCAIEGCGKVLRRDNTSGYCSVHRKISPSYKTQQKEYSREYRVAHKEECNEYSREYRVAHKEERKEYSREYRVAHKEECKEKDKKYRKANPGIRREFNQRRRAALAGARGNITDAQWKDICVAFTNRCAYCRGALPLTQDHVIPISRGGSHTVENVVPACESCNSSKSAKTPAEWWQTGVTPGVDDFERLAPEKE